MPKGLEPIDVVFLHSRSRQRKARATRESYHIQWRSFRRWCASIGAERLPADPWIVAKYIDERDREGWRTSSMAVALAAIRHRHRDSGHPDPTKLEPVPNLMDSIRQLRKERGGEAPKQARGLTAACLEQIRGTLHLPLRGETPKATKARAAKELALMSVMRDALLRQSEAVALRWGDVVFASDGSALVTIRRSKTSATPATQFVRPRAAATLKRWRAVAPKTGQTDRVFGWRTPDCVARTIKRAAIRAGLGEGFSGHSCRVGMAQDLAAAGAALPELMQAGRWKSARIVSRYIENIAATRGAVARLAER